MAIDAVSKGLRGQYYLCRNKFLDKSTVAPQTCRGQERNVCLSRHRYKFAPVCFSINHTKCISGFASHHKILNFPDVLSKLIL